MKKSKLIGMIQYDFNMIYLIIRWWLTISWLPCRLYSGSVQRVGIVTFYRAAPKS